MNSKHIFLSSVISLLLNSPLVMATNQVEKTNTENATTLIANENFSGTYIGFTNPKNVFASTLTIVGPNGFSVSESVDIEIPAIELSAFGVLTDGLYTYQLTAALSDEFVVATHQPLNNGRGENERKQLHKAIKQSGHFYIESGEIKNFATQTHSVE
ncbi:hypothetical protein [Colwellia sp. MB02u-9]|uniref:hypothetical protein n=1 Tax=Colwellia sp. MB02u-9 TaxID=2759823 RepID=UPI0015F69996|nr:hypothetical protein [Colwellia sp. MB02u-9]MBA6296280.1 hypothetical protein [Colwellia sp. MB02u-9]